MNVTISNALKSSAEVREELNQVKFNVYQQLSELKSRAVDEAQDHWY